MMDETFRFPPPTPPGGDWPGWGAPPASGAAPGFDADLLAADPADVRFALDPASVRVQDERADPWNTHYTASATVEVSAPGVAPQPVDVRYSVTLRNEHASPLRMREVNPFDPATIPPRTRIDVQGADTLGTPLEASFQALAQANGLAATGDVRLSLEMTADGELRVMTASQALFDAPREGGPASLPADREDFIRHTALLGDPAGADRAGYARMLLDGTPHEASVRIAEDVEGRAIAGTVTDTGSGETNAVVWTLDDSGRPRSADATLTWEPGSGGRESDRIEANAQSRFRADNDMKGSGDDVGHVIAYRFVNGHGPVNMFPQQSHFNQRVFAAMEQEWADWLGAGMDVRIQVALGPENTPRPDQVRVDYEVIDPASGRAVYDPRMVVFDNEAGQVYDRIAREDMDSMIGTRA